MFHAPKSEGAGNAGCALHPRSRVQNGKRKRTRAYRFSGGTPTFPAQWFYGLLRALPGDQDLFVTVAPRMMAGLTPGWAGFASAGLDANHEASGPHDFAVRSNPSSPSGFAGHGPSSPGSFAGHGAVRQRAVDRSRTRTPALPSRVTPDAAASTASRPASLTIRIRPSWDRTGRDMLVIWGRVKRNFGKSEINPNDGAVRKFPRGRPVRRARRTDTGLCLADGSGDSRRKELSGFWGEFDRFRQEKSQ